MTVKELLKRYPDAIIEDNIIYEGYGDGYINLELCLDEEVNHYYYDKNTKNIKIYI